MSNHNRLQHTHSDHRHMRHILGFLGAAAVALVTAGLADMAASGSPEPLHAEARN